MGRMEYLALRTDPATADLIDSDINELKVAAKRLMFHASKLGGGVGFGTSFLKWIACFAAMSVPSLAILCPRFCCFLLFFLFT